MQLRFIVEWANPERTAVAVTSLAEAVKLVKDRCREDFLAAWLRKFPDDPKAHEKEAREAAEKQIKNIRFEPWAARPNTGSPATMIESHAQLWENDTRGRRRDGNDIPVESLARIVVELEPK